MARPQKKFPPASKHGLWLVQIRMMRSRPNPLGWCETKNNGQDMWDGMTFLHPLKKVLLLLCNLMHTYSSKCDIEFWEHSHRLQMSRNFFAEPLHLCVCLVVYGSFSLWVNCGGSNKKFASHFTKKLSCISVEQAFYLFTWTEQLVFFLWELAIRVLVLVSLLQYLSQQCIAQGFFFHVLRNDLRV